MLRADTFYSKAIKNTCSVWVLYRSRPIIWISTLVLKTCHGRFEYADSRALTVFFFLYCLAWDVIKNITLLLIVNEFDRFGGVILWYKVYCGFWGSVIYPFRCGRDLSFFRLYWLFSFLHCTQQTSVIASEYMLIRLFGSCVITETIHSLFNFLHCTCSI